MSIVVKILKPRALAAFSLAMLLALTTSGLAFTLTHGFTATVTTALQGSAGRTIVMQEGAMTRHTSIVPLTLASSLSMLQGVDARAMTIIPTTTGGKSLSIRGVGDPSGYRDWLLEGSPPSQEGAWALLGEGAAARLGLGVGDLWTAASPIRPRILVLQVTGVYRTGDPRDHEAVVPLWAGAALRGLPGGTASYIEVEGMKREEIERLVRGLYNLSLTHGLSRGRISVMDTEGAVVSSLPVEEGVAMNLRLPFGHYRIAYSQSHYTTNLTQLLLTQSQHLHLNRTEAETYTLRVQASEASQPTLILENGTVTEGDWRQGSWLLEAPPGLHRLRLNGTSHQVMLMGDTVFHPTPAGEEHQTRVSVLWSDGREAGDYLLTVKNQRGEVVATSRSPSSTTAIALTPGLYQAEVSKPPYLATEEIEVPRDERLTVTLPVISNPRRIPPSYFKELKAVAPTETSTQALGSLLGLTTLLLLASTATLTLLSTTATLTVQKALYTSARQNLQLLTQLGADRWRRLRMLGPTTLLLNLALGAAAGCLANTLYTHSALSQASSFLGYSLPLDQPLTLAFTTLLALASWLLSTIVTQPWTERETG